MSAVDAWSVSKEPTSQAGIAVDPFGFEDSPECEVIACGMGDVLLNSVVIGRQGNYLIWGYSSDPERWTKSACDVFVNCIYYMSQIKSGAIVSRAAIGRDWALEWARGCVRSETGDLRSTDYGGRFSSDVLLQCHSSGDLVKYCESNSEYLYQTATGFSVDKILMDGGISNRRLEFFDCVAQLKSREADAPQANELLSRYAPFLQGKSGSEIREFVEQNKRDLFFSDVGGYRWFLR